MNNMQVNDATLFADFQGLSRLRGQVRQDAGGNERAVAQQFEALFVQMMLKAMRDAVPEGDMLGSDQMKFHQQMFDQQLSLQLSRSGGVGLADNMLQQLGFAEKQTRPALARDGVARSAWSSARPVLNIEPGISEINASVPRDAFTPTDPEDFIRQLWPQARKAATALGVEPEVLVAQAALESGWGQHVIQRRDGSSSYNLFGIKADAAWQGDRVSVTTVEYRDGVAARERANFRAYDSLEHAFDDYVNFLKGQPRYLHALESNVQGQEFVRQLQDAGYATDPNYAGKVGQILEQSGFGAVVASLRGAIQ